MRRRTPLAVLALVVAAVPGCANVEGPGLRGTPDHGIARRAGTPSWRWTTLGESVDRPVADPLSPARDQWIVEAGLASDGAAARPVDDEGTPVGGGLVVAVGADAPTRAVETASVETGTPVAFRVGTVRWAGDGADAAGLACAGREVVVEWFVCVRTRGSCTLELDAVPRLVGAGGVTVLERYRVRRALAVGEAIAVRAGGRGASADAAALVGGPGSRFVLRVRA